MAEIKISELSIGDWVCYDKDTTPCSIRSIYRTGVQDCVVMNDSYFKEGVIGFVDMLKPIPLTAEILEKNGFVGGEIYEGISTIVFTNGNISISMFKKSKWYRLRIYNALGDTELCSAIVHNVHQLQHALRLAGVKKEIEL